TLTEGKPRLTNVIALGGVSELDLLRLVATLEQSSEHPVARAIVAGAQERGLRLGSAENFQSFPGKGIVGSVDGHQEVVGSRSFLESKGIPTATAAKDPDIFFRRGESAVWVSIDGKLSGAVGVADTVKPSTPDALQRLRNSGLRLVMLTGDNR